MSLLPPPTDTRGGAEWISTRPMHSSPYCTYSAVTLALPNDGDARPVVVVHAGVHVCHACGTLARSRSAVIRIPGCQFAATTGTSSPGDVRRVSQNHVRARAVRLGDAVPNYGRGSR